MCRCVPVCACACACVPVCRCAGVRVFDALLVVIQTYPNTNCPLLQGSYHQGSATCLLCCCQVRFAHTSTHSHAHTNTDNPTPFLHLGTLFHFQHSFPKSPRIRIENDALTKKQREELKHCMFEVHRAMQEEAESDESSDEDVPLAEVADMQSGRSSSDGTSQARRNAQRASREKPLPSPPPSPPPAAAKATPKRKSRGRTRSPSSSASEDGGSGNNSGSSANENENENENESESEFESDFDDYAPADQSARKRKTGRRKATSTDNEDEDEEDEEDEDEATSKKQKKREKAKQSASKSSKKESDKVMEYRRMVFRCGLRPKYKEIFTEGMCVRV